MLKGNLIAHYVNEINQYFIQSAWDVFVLIDADMKILSYNTCFKNLVSSGREFEGEMIDSFLLPESRNILPLSDSQNTRSVRLNFKSESSSAVPLQCHIFKVNQNKHLIVGGHIMLSNEDILKSMTRMSNEMANLNRDLNRKNNELKEAHSKIKTLSGIVPICLHCKGIRDDKGYWNRLEEYITEHSDAQISHGICDDCLEKFYPDLVDTEERAEPEK